MKQLAILVLLTALAATPLRSAPSPTPTPTPTPKPKASAIPRTDPSRESHVVTWEDLIAAGIVTKEVAHRFTSPPSPTPSK